MRRFSIIFIFISILIILDSYTYQGFEIAFQAISKKAFNIITFIYWTFSGLSILFILLYFFGNADRWSQRFKSFLMVGLLANFLSKIFIVTILLTEDIQRGIVTIVRRISNSFSDEGVEKVITASRSPLWSQIALSVGSVPIIAMGYGVISGAHDYRVRRHTIKIPNLPKAFDGLRIGQLSDIHSGSFFNKIAVKGGVEMLNREKADIVFFTGDLVNNEAVEMKDYVSIFEKVQAPLGVYSVLGNHDYGDYTRWPSVAEKQKNLNDLKALQAQMRWQLLMNEHKIIEINGDRLAVLGNENWSARGFSKYGQLAKAYQGLEDVSTKLLLSHDPTHWAAEVLKDYKDIDVVFSGHTHGMQMGVEIKSLNIKWSPAKYFYKEWAGLYENQGQYLYVNRGYGYLGYPGRIGIPPEITIIELKSA